MEERRGESGASQRKKCRLQRRHTIAGHSHNIHSDSGNVIKSVPDRTTLLVRTPNERKPRRSSFLHRPATT